MSRSGYHDDCENNWGLICYRGAVNSAINGKRGQAFLRELLAALDAMPEKRLVTNELEADGEHCTLGVLGQARGIDMSTIDPEDPAQVSKAFGIAESMAREIVWENDEQVSDYEWVDIVGPPRWLGYGHPQARVPVKDHGARLWRYMREWVAAHIAPTAAKGGAAAEVGS
jgi:hypothetical protein